MKIMVAEGKGCSFLAAQYANKGELVLRRSAFVKKFIIQCNTTVVTLILKRAMLDMSIF